jgi:protein-tyrosine phosphatase
MIAKRAILTTALLLVLGISSAVSAPRPVRIAFVDTGNTGRSVTAEALAAATIAKQHLNVQVISRAVNFNPFNTQPEVNFVALLRRKGIDIAHHTAIQFGPQEAAFSDVILTMTDAHKAWIVTHFPDAKDKVFTLSEYATGTNQEVLDAFGKPMDFYKTVLAQLEPLVAAAVAKAAPKP